MAYKIAADLVVITHLLWILFLILGALIGYRLRWVMWLHLAGLAYSVPMQIFSWICPLTRLEVWLRQRHDPALAYPGSFIAHYAEGLVYLRVDPAQVFGATLLIVIVNMGVYAAILKRGRCRKREG